MRRPAPVPGLFGSPAVDLDALAPHDHVVLGAPYGTPYHMQGVHSDAANAPRLFRERANRRFGEHADRYDFSLGGTLLGDTDRRLVDAGDLPGDPRDLEGNAVSVTAAVTRILGAGAVPIVLGGDDSVPIPVVAAFNALARPVNVLQIDAHIDYADEAHGLSNGYSSTMRRIREMPWVHHVVQVGARGTGSARPGDVTDALAAGNRIVTAGELRERGTRPILQEFDREHPWFVTLDVDGLDPSIAPATSCPLPGGLSFTEAEELLAAIGGELGLAGIDVVEHFPSLDIGDTTSVTLARLLTVLIGRSVRMETP